MTGWTLQTPLQALSMTQPQPERTRQDGLNTDQNLFEYLVVSSMSVIPQSQITQHWSGFMG